MEDLLVELKERDIYDCVNIIIVSDHGERKCKDDAVGGDNCYLL